MVARLGAMGRAIFRRRGAGAATGRRQARADRGCAGLLRQGPRRGLVESIMARGAGGGVLAALLLGLVAGAETAAAAPAAPPRRPVLHYACPRGDENDAEAGCVGPGSGSEPDYEWYWAPYGSGRRRG